jgi:hypothetical protein
MIIFWYRYFTFRVFSLQMKIQKISDGIMTSIARNYCARSFFMNAILAIIMVIMT